MRALLAALALAGCASVARADEPLAAMAFFEGCWVGAFEGAGELRDARCFSPMQGGKQWRDTHEVVGTGYGGETIYAWDADAGRIDIAYYANDGGLMRGAATSNAAGFDVSDARYVGADGSVQRLRSRYVRTTQGFETITEREEGGVWRPFMRIAYTRRAAE
ncbi:hypothetical protein U91I_03244 [alpha proteobacterium U9-1i]|nr:hypothetical protein U91I_03244 [alpha proteobacterium U9-1i]